MSSSLARAVWVIVTTAPALAISSSRIARCRAWGPPEPCAGPRWSARAGLQQRHDILAVGAAVDTVFVLNDHDIEAVQRLNGSRSASGRPRHQVLYDIGASRGPRLVEHPHDEARSPDWRRLSEQGRSEGCQPALSRRIRTEQGVRRWHETALCRHFLQDKPQRKRIFRIAGCRWHLTAGAPHNGANSHDFPGRGSHPGSRIAW